MSIVRPLGIVRSLDAVRKSNARRGRKLRVPALATLFGVVGSAMELAAWFNPKPLQSQDDAPPPERPVWIAQISDPHLFEEAKRPTWRDDETEDQRAFARALQFLDERAFADGTVPDALVITGDLGIDSSFIGKRDTTDRPMRRDRQVTVVADLLRASPVKDVFVVAGNNDVANERPDPAELRYFHAFVDEVGDSLQRSGVRLRDLTACYAEEKPSIAGCFHDLPRGVRLVGFASATFKNAPVLAANDPALLKYAESRRAQAAAASRALDSRFVQDLSSLVTATSRAGKKAVILTHEPDLDDPYAIESIRAWSGPLPDPSTRYTPAVWNVDTQVHAQWVRAVSDPAVVAVLAGHFHSSNRDDYLRPYLASAAAGRADPRRLFVSPPLAIKNQNGKSPGARGLSLYRIAGGEVHREIAWYDAARGFTAAQPERSATPPPDTTASTTAGATADGVDAPDRMGVVLFAILAATGAMLMAYKRGVREWQGESLAPNPGAPAFAGAPRTPRVTIAPAEAVPGAAAAATHDVDAVHVRFHPPVPAEPPKFSMLAYFAYAWLIPWALGGLVVALLLFANRWSDRDIVAFWYAAGFSVWALVIWVAIRVSR